MIIPDKLKGLILFLILLSYNTTLAAIDNSIIQKIQANLAKLDKAAIEFVQTDKKNTVAEGILLIEKPYFLRCNYYPPHPLLIVSGKKFLSIYDYSMETLSRLESSDNIIAILFQSDWLKNKKFKILETKANQNNLVLRISYSENSQKAELYFDKESFDLEKIVIFEMDKASIVINFAKPLVVKNFKRTLFEIRAPEIFGKPKHLNKEEIEKLYEYK
jgi:outer membrane lipoprotein-sorting protein